MLSRSALNGTILLLLASTSYAQETIAVTPEAIQIGVVKPATATAHTVEVTNATGMAVKLLSVDVECAACTRVQFTPITLEPGKSTKIEVTFKPMPDEEGTVRRSITIHTSHPKQPTITVPVIANVASAAGFWPPTITPKPQAPGTDIEVNFEIVNVSERPLTPLYATGPVDGPKLSVPHDAIPAGKRTTIKGKWHLPSKVGQMTGQLVLFVDHPVISKLSIPYAIAVEELPSTAPGHGRADGPATRENVERGESTTGSRLGARDSTDMSGTQPAPTPASPPQMVNLDLKESIPLKDFVDIVASQLKLNLIYDEAAMNVPVSIRLNGPLPAEALLPLLKTILQAKGLAMVPTERADIWRIVTSREAQTLTEPGKARAPGQAPATGPAQIVTEFITPQSIDLETAAGLLRGFITPGVGQLTTVPRIKALIVTDYASQLARLHRLMDLIDKPQATASVEVLPLKAAEAGPLADRVTKLLVQIDKTEGRTESDKVFLSPSDDGTGIVLVGPESELPRVTALLKRFDTAPPLVRVDYPVNDAQRAQALDTIRQVLGPSANAAGRDGMPPIVTAPQRLSIIATEGQHRRIKDLLAGVTDGGADGAGVQLKAYRIQNRDAAEIYTTLTRLIGDARGGSLNLETPPPRMSKTSGFSNEGISRVGSLPGSSSTKNAAEDVPSGGVIPSPSLARSSFSPGTVSITIDQGTNTLLIAATGETHQRLGKLINELDRKQGQVLLEVMLVSVADSKTFSAAVDVAVRGQFAGSTIGVGTNAGISGGDFVKGRTPTVGPGLNAAIFNPASFSVFLQALESTNKARILSMPQILALDNKPALLRSTQEEPYTSVNASTTVATTSFAGFAEAGTTLEMTPHIAPADYLNLEYRLEVSSFTGASTGGGVPPPKRSDAITSFVSVPDGSTVVLGGMRSANNSKSVSKVPGLGDIPILGWLGRKQGSTDSTAAFYVFVRPTILRAAKFEDLKVISSEHKRQAGIPGDYPETKPRFIGN